MKKIITTLVALMFAIGTQAQLSAPNELHCTEQAITFKADIRSGWHLDMFRIGRPEYGTPISVSDVVLSERLMNDLPRSQQPLETASSTFKMQSSLDAGQYAVLHSLVPTPADFLFGYKPDFYFNDTLNLLPGSFASKRMLVFR